MEAWPDLIGMMVQFWDGKNMVFRFGDVEMTPTIAEFLSSYESIGMCNKRKHKPDSDLCIPHIWGFDIIKKNSYL